MPTLPVRPLCRRGVEIACLTTAGVTADPEADLAALARAAAAALARTVRLPAGTGARSAVVDPGADPTRTTLSSAAEGFDHVGRRSVVGPDGVVPAAVEHPHLVDRRGSPYGPSAQG